MADPHPSSVPFPVLQHNRNHSSHSQFQFQGDHGNGHGYGRLSRVQSRASSIGMMSTLGTGEGSELVDKMTRLMNVMYEGSSQGDATKDGAMKEVDDFLQEWVEADCIYESPFLTFHSRSLLRNALSLSRSLSSTCLPSITPSGLLTHASNLSSWAWDKVSSSKPKTNQESNTSNENQSSDQRTWLGKITAVPFKLFARNRQDLSPAERALEAKKEAQAWWAPYQVRSELGEMHSMESYDGYQLAYISHTIHISLLPSLLPPSIPNRDIYDHPYQTGNTTPATSTFPHAQSLSFPPHPSFHHPHHHHYPSQTLPSKSLTTTTLESILHYQLNIHTLVELNEANRIVYIRDLVDLRDVWEGLIPFGRMSAWVARRLGGVAMAGIGGLLSSDNGGELRDEPLIIETEDKATIESSSPPLALETSET